MRSFLALLFLTLLGSTAGGTPAMRGMALGLYASDPDDPDHDYVKMLDEMKALGVNTVSLVVHWRQHDVRSETLAAHPDITVPDERVRKVIRAAHERGLDVFLFPIIDVEVRRPLEWRGTIAPKDTQKWWMEYEKFILHYARIASEEKVAVFSVGSELVSTETWQDRWYHLISSVERIYHGNLIYSANWDHYEPVTFWDHLDYIGVTAYNELTKSSDASEADLAAAWGGVRDKLVGFAAKQGRPLVITEIGYTSQDGAAVHPWDYTSRAAVDVEEQRRCYAAFVTTWKDEAALGGVFFWNWFGRGGASDTSYTPKGKPAEAVLKGWYLP